MKKILVVTEVFHPEDFIINDLVSEWQARGVQVDVLTQWPSYPQSQIFEGYTNKEYGTEKWGTSTIYRFKVVEGYKDSKVRKIINYLCFIRKGCKIAKKIGANYDHVFAFHTGPITTALPAAYIKKRFGTPYTIWVLDLWPETFFEYGFPHVQPLIFLIDKLVKSIISRADNVLVSSSQFIPSLKRFINNGKTATYIPNWMVKYTPETSSIKLDRSKFNFTFAGNIGTTVNLQCVIEGFALAQIADAQINIFGDGSGYNDIKRYTEQHNITNVTLHGRVPQCEIDDILSQSDALLFSLVPTPGIMKVEPFKIQSYLKAGKPILGITLGAGKEIIESNKLGICANPNDPKAIRDSFIEMITYAKENQDQVAQAAQKLMQTRFNREKIIQTIDSIIGIK